MKVIHKLRKPEEEIRSMDILKRPLQQPRLLDVKSSIIFKGILEFFNIEHEEENSFNGHFLRLYF